MSKKDLPPPKISSELSEMLRSQHSTADDTAGTAPEGAAAPPAKAPAKEKVKMARRSWYLSEAVADELSEAVDEIHYSTRQPKHAVLDALIRAGLEHRDDVAASFTDPK